MAHADDVAGMARRALSLDERRGLQALTSGAAAPTVPDEPAAEAQLDRWRSLVAPGDPDAFVRRLAWDGLDVGRARALLVPPGVDADEPRPSWTTTLLEVLEEARPTRGDADGALRRDDPCFAPDHPVAFEDVLVPFVRVARRRLEAEAGDALARLAPGARATLEHRLLRRLGWVTARTLLVEFAVHRQRHLSGLGRLVAAAQGMPPDHDYVRFTAGLLDGGLTDLFQRYPVLARLTTTVTDLWVESTAELVSRLEADRDCLGETFHPGRPVGRVVDIGDAASDAHHRGRSVLALTFESGLRLVYKPKDVGLEQAYGDLLAWLEERGSPLPLKAVRVVARPGYGWSEFAPTLPCSDAGAASRYYERAGLLLGLVYGLAGNDCHYENLVAHGEHPLLVDVETFMHPKARSFEDDSAAQMSGARAAASDVFWESVLSTGLLPSWIIAKDGRSIDPSGLGGVGEQPGLGGGRRWVDVNTDGMHVVDDVGAFRPTQNVPVLDGHPLSPNDFVEEIVTGLRAMYELLLEHRDALLAPGGPLAAFASQPVRFLLRNTRVYALVLDGALGRQHLRDGAAFSIELDVLTRGLVTTSSPNVFWPLHHQEQEAMERLDIPAFVGRADSADLELDDGTIVRDAFSTSGFQLMGDRLRALTPDDLDRQVAYTRASFYSRTASSVSSVANRSPEDDGDPSPLTRADLVAAAQTIADDLCRTAIRAPDGGTSWIGVAFLPQADRYQLQPTGYDLYSGNAGIALFLATLAAVTGSDRRREEALAAVRQVSQAVRSHPGRLVTGLGIGGASGAGSLVYALTRTSLLLEDAGLLDDARRLGSHITPEVVAADESLDVVAGSAGALLALLHLHEATGDAEALERAVSCGAHLMSTQLTEGDCRGAWSTPLQTGLTGFSHGAAGIAYALARLATHPSDRRVLAAAEAAVAYESRVYDPAAENWPDRRPNALALTDGEPSFVTQWCHGASGIGLARLAGLPGLDGPGIRADIDRAVATTLRHGTQGLDHLCCGALGRAELLLSVGRAFDRPDLVDHASRYAAQVVGRAQRGAGYAVMGRLPHGVTSPGLFQGTAGIGYELLRLADPDRVPSVLTWS